jgi:arylsulfatase A-like enzyme
MDAMSPLKRLWIYALAGLAGGVLVWVVETADRLATLWPSFASASEASLYAAYLAPDVLMGLAVGVVAGVVLAALGAVREGFERLAARVSPERKALVGAALAAVAVGVVARLATFAASGTVEEPLFRVLKKVDDRIVRLPFAVEHFGALLTVGLLVGAAALVAIDLGLGARPRGRLRLVPAALAALGIATLVGLYAVDSRLFYGRYEATMHVPATLAELAIAFVTAGLSLSALRVDALRRRAAVVAAAVTAVAVLATGFATWHAGANQNLKALLWRRSIVARRAYQAMSAAADRDGDGFPAALAGGDVDDRDPAVNLLATEIPANGVDDNCIGGDLAAAPPAPPAPPQPVPAGAAKNFILISIDTLRANRMSAYGYARPTSPRLAELGRLGTFFERAYSQGTNTGVSFASMQRSATRGAIFDDDRPTLFGRLAEAGFVTTFINARRDDSWLETRRWTRYRRIILDGIQTYDHTAGDPLWDGDKVTDRAIEYLSSISPDERHATWVHYLDPHEPRKKMAPFDFGDSSSDKYDTEVAFADREVGRLVDWLIASGRMKDSIVVLMADHGESFLDHGMDLHGNRPYDEQVHVPLVMWAPDVPPARVADPVGIWDVAPSVLSYLGLPAIPGAEGRDVLRSPIVARPIFSETPLNLVEVSFFAYAVTDGDWRYIYDVRGNTVELYDLASDPLELRNLADARPEKASELRAVLAGWLDATRSVTKLRDA